MHKSIRFALFAPACTKPKRTCRIKSVEHLGFDSAKVGSIYFLKGIALFKYGKKIGGADVIFGEDDDSILLGTLTLESSGLSLDPLKRELKELPMML